jgi:hypothetical protein
LIKNNSPEKIDGNETVFDGLYGKYIQIESLSKDEYGNSLNTGRIIIQNDKDVKTEIKNDSIVTHKIDATEKMATNQLSCTSIEGVNIVCTEIKCSNLAIKDSKISTTESSGIDLQYSETLNQVVNFKIKAETGGVNWYVRIEDPETGLPVKLLEDINVYYVSSHWLLGTIFDCVTVKAGTTYTSVQYQNQGLTPPKIQLLNPSNNSYEDSYTINQTKKGGTNILISAGNDGDIYIQDRRTGENQVTLLQYIKNVINGTYTE